MNLAEALQQEGMHQHRFIRIGDDLHLQPQDQRFDTHKEFAEGLGILALIVTIMNDEPDSIDAGTVTITNTPEERSKPTGVRIVHREQRSVIVGGNSYSMEIPLKGHEQVARVATVDLIKSLSPGFDIRSHTPSE